MRLTDLTRLLLLVNLLGGGTKWYVRIIAGSSSNTHSIQAAHLQGPEAAAGAAPNQTSDATNISIVVQGPFEEHVQRFG